MSTRKEQGARTRRAKVPKTNRRPRIGADGLTAKQRAFVEHYLVCWNASEAARRAGYRGKANVVGPRLLANVSIRALVDARLAEMAMSANEVLARLSDEAAGDLDYFLNGQGLDFDKARKAGKMHLLKSFSVTAEGFRIEIHDAQAAKVHLGRHYGLFGERTTALNIDVSKLNDEQLDRLAAGEDPLRVLAAAGPGGAGAPAEGPTPEP